MERNQASITCAGRGRGRKEVTFQGFEGYRQEKKEWEVIPGGEVNGDDRKRCAGVEMSVLFRGHLVE